MKQITKPKGFSGAGLLIFLGWLIYSSSYLGKVNYSANITQIMDSYGVTKAEAGIAPSFFFFAYGIGQVFNGFLCKRYNIKQMIALSLFISGGVNLAIALGVNFSVVKWLWMINGFSLSVLWPSLIRLLSENLPQKSLSTSSVVMGTTTAVGTFIIYGLSALYAKLFASFKPAFFTASIVVLITALIWLIFYKKAVYMSREEQAFDEPETKPTPSSNQNVAIDNKEKKLLFLTIGFLSFAAIGVNLIKDGLGTWVPAILKDEFSMDDSLSILLTLFLPMVAIVGNAFALKIHKKIPNYANQCGIIFFVIAILICVIIGLLKLEMAALMLVTLIVANFLVSSLNSLITSIFPMFMRGKVNSGMFAGVLNGFCYLGSTISSSGLGIIADVSGWTAVFITLALFSAIVCIVWGLYHIARKFIK